MIDPGRVVRVQTCYDRQILKFANAFGDHEGVGVPRIARWLSQFEDADIPLALKILERITYISTVNIRTMVRQLVGLSCAKFHQFDRERILFVPVGNPHEGSAVIVRALREEIDEDQIKHMNELERLQPETYDALVFLDDFSGTGDQLREWWESVSTLVLPREVPFVMALLVLNERARNVIRQFMDIICVYELNDNYNVLLPTSTFFDGAEKEKIIEYCRQTRCEDEYVLGYGHCGLLLAFKHQCPDNSLPILWYWHGDDWEAIFKRSAI